MSAMAPDWCPGKLWMPSAGELVVGPDGYCKKSRMKMGMINDRG